MLHACLTRLAKAVTNDVQVVVSLDRGYLRDCREVAESFSGTFPTLFLRLMQNHRHRGNSYNVLSGLGDCLKGTGQPDLVHVVEEDILVSRGYFAFHEAMHAAAPDAFAVSACRNQNAPAEGPAYLHASYQSLGVSFRPDRVQAFLGHAAPAYYGAMQQYCQRNFPRSVIPPGHCEQDGLINRVRESLGARTVYAERPRAYHAGFYGYNRAGTKLLEGYVHEKSERILGMSTEELNEMAGAIKDYEAIDLDEILPTGPEEEALRNSWATST